MSTNKHLPAPHGEKLKALLQNPKLPASDRPRVSDAIRHYQSWIKALQNTSSDDTDILSTFVNATNAYKRFIECDLIFDSKNDFLYRQKGQLKLDNTILEEFLPYLVDERLVPGIRSIPNLSVGPQCCYAGLFFGPVGTPLVSGGVFLKLKDQDFTVAENLFLRLSKHPTDSNSNDFMSSVNVAYFAAELKTNLDKTMFQEAASTARELKACVSSSKYLLLCEWLDMSPIDTRITSIDEIIILRKAKRLNSNVRAEYSTSTGRKLARDAFLQHITDHPLNIDCFRRIVEHLNQAFPEPSLIDEAAVLQKGYF